MSQGPGRGAGEGSATSELIAALHENTRRLLELEELARVGSWEWDVAADVVSWSDEMYRTFGVKPDQFEATYEGFLSRLHPDDRPLARRNVEMALQAREPYAADYRVVWPDGEVRWLHCRGRAIVGSDGTVERLIGTSQDITDRKELEHLLAHQALHDPLTGLPNRSLLLDRLDHAIQRTSRTGRHTAVLFVDLDRFKAVNDGAGHDVGDEVLRTIARRLCDAVRQHDTVARYGGDEFVIVAEDLTSPEEAAQLAERVLTAASEPIPLPSGDVQLSASIGAAAHAIGSTSEELVRDADAAMYKAKQRGGHTVVWADAGPSRG